MFEQTLLIATLIVVFVSAILFVSLYVDLNRLKERSKHHRKMINGFYSYKQALNVGMVDEDGSIPENYEDLNVVRPYRNSFLMSRNHVIDQEMYDKLAFYADTFAGVNFGDIVKFELDSYFRHAKWKGEWGVQRFLNYMYPTEDILKEQKRAVN